MQIFAPFNLKRNHRIVRIVALVLPLVCLAVLLAQTALAQNTYVITDGDQVTVHTSYATNPETVLLEAGVELAENDFYTTANGDGVSEITVQREMMVTIDNCGEIASVTSYGETVYALLDRLGIETYGPYTVSENLDAAVYDGMEVTIGNVVTNQEVYTVEIPYQVIQREDATIPSGQTKVLVPGAAGQMRCQAEVTYESGEEISRIVTEESVVSHPVDRVVLIGTGEPEADTSAVSGELQIGDGVITLPTGEVLTYTHSGTFKGTAYTHGIGGVDFITATGTTVHWGTVAVDPKVIPYGTRMFIITNDGEYVYGLSTAEDCGGGVNGNHVDLYFPTVDSCFQFGVRECTIYFLGESQIWS